MARKLIYVGYRTPNPDEVFRPGFVPTQESHGHLYAACVGPFRTIRAANIMAKFGGSNPHLQTVADAERMAARVSTGELDENLDPIR